MIVTITLIILLVSLYIRNKRQYKNYPPGPTCLPFLGNAWFMIASDPMKHLNNLAKKFGDVVGFHCPTYNMIAVNGYEAIKEACANEHFQGRITDSCLARGRFDGQMFGLIFADGEQWKHQRRFTIHHFKNLGFGKNSHENMIIKEAKALVDEVASKEGKPFAISSLLQAVGINIVWSILSNERLSYNDPNLCKLNDSMQLILRGITFYGSVANAFPFLSYIFPKQTGSTDVMEGTKGILQFLKKAIKEHVENRIKGDPKDFIDIYLEQLENGQDNEEHFFSETQLEALCMDILFAGSDTSSGNLVFAILFMCLDKKIQEKIYQEIKENVGENSVPTMEAKNKLIYTSATLMEVLRYRPPGPITIPHRATSDTTLRGYNIPKDTVLFLNVTSVFMDTNYWKDGDIFKPERFITTDGRLRTDERLFAFGKGQRKCLGETVAKMTTLIILSSLVQRFEFSLYPDSPNFDTAGHHGFNLAPPHFQVIATPRNKN